MSLILGFLRPPDESHFNDNHKQSRLTALNLGNLAQLAPETTLSIFEKIQVNAVDNFRFFVQTEPYTNPG